MTFSADDLDESNARQIEKAAAVVQRLKADAWDEGAMWAAVEVGAARPDEQWLAPGDNPYRTAIGGGPDV